MDNKTGYSITRKNALRIANEICERQERSYRDESERDWLRSIDALDKLEYVVNRVNRYHVEGFGKYHRLFILYKKDDGLASHSFAGSDLISVIEQGFNFLYMIYH